MASPFTFGSCFSGLGGMDKGLQDAGMIVRWQVESDPWCQRVLTKHWPDVRRYGDVREVRWHEAEQVDLICGGVPCQDISRAGRRAGIDGARSGLWAEMYQAVCILRPRFVLVENTTSLLVRGLGRILADLAQIGYDAEWDCLPAAAFGAPHIRDRLYLLAYPRSERYGTPQATIFAGWSQSQLHAGWQPEPRVGRVASRAAHRVERLKGLGNIAVPQVVEWIGRRIIEAHHA